ncbi:MAG: hypothetical protein WDO13_17700 [Verrucomicrobiota bacterium]
MTTMPAQVWPLARMLCTVSAVWLIVPSMPWATTTTGKPRSKAQSHTS